MDHIKLNNKIKLNFTNKSDQKTISQYFNLTFTKIYIILKNYKKNQMKHKKI